MRSPKQALESAALVVFAGLLVVGAIALIRAMERRGAPEERPASLPASDAGVPVALASSIAEIRDKKLKLGAPAWKSQRLAIGTAGLVWLNKDRYLWLALPGFQAETQPLEGARAALELPGGSIVIVAERRTLRLDPGAKEPVEFARTPFLPGSELVPEGRDSKLFWVRQRATGVLVRYELALGEHRLLPHEGLVELPHTARGAFSTMRDGSWIYALEGALEVQLPRGRPRRFALEPERAPWRLLPGPRVDEVWAITPSGEVTLYRVLDRLYRVLELETGEAPFDAAVSSERLGVLSAKEGEGERKFRLRVFNKSGQAELDLELGADRATPDENWAARVLDREIALSDAPPLVALSDPAGLRVFELGSGKLAYSAH